MATPKKKHLIELMIEEGFEWPEGAEYAAQDKRDCNLYFFKTKPFVTPGDDYYAADGGAAGYQHQLPSLCRNWHQTIVTRDQYAEAVAAVAGKTNQSKESEDVGPYAIPENTESLTINLVPQNGFYNLNGTSGVHGVMPTESIESLLAEIKEKREEHDALVAKADALAIEIASIEQQVNDKLNEYGFAMSPVAAPSGSVDEPWKIGDKCIVTDSPCNELWVDLECVLVNIDEDDKNLHYLVKHQNKGRCWVRDIRRP